MSCAASGYNEGIWIQDAYHTKAVVDAGSQMVLIKDVHVLLLLIIEHQEGWCLCLCPFMCDSSMTLSGCVCVWGGSVLVSEHVCVPACACVCERDN